jgi:hypothetical protein
MTAKLKTHWFSVWLMALLFSFSWSLPAVADIQVEASELLETADNYSVSLFGQTAVKIKMPIYGKKGTDHWISKAEIKVFDVKNSKSKSSLLKVEITKNDDISNSADKVNYGFTSDVPGMMELINYTSGNLALSSTKKTKDLPFNGTDDCWAEFEWEVPLQYLGKDIQFDFTVTLSHTNKHDYKSLSIPSKKISVPAKQDVMYPMLTNAVISADEKYVGEIQVPWLIAVADTSVTKVICGYKDTSGKWQQKELEKAASGMIRLSATENYDSLYVEVDYTQWKSKNGKGIKEELKGLRSDYYNVPILHAPVNLSAAIVESLTATVQLDWEIKDVGHEDLINPDNFQIQRSISGKDDDFVDIATEVFMSDQGTYTFTDKTILESLKAEDFDANGGIHPVYRIRRTMSAGWGWQDNPLAASVSFSCDHVYQLAVSDAYAKWDNEEMRTVKLNWDYQKPTQKYVDDRWRFTQIFVYDERSEMRLVVEMYREDGKFLDNQEYILTKDEILAKTKTVALPRSCVNYAFKLVVNQGTSPVKPFAEGIEISNAEDWRKFIGLVNSRGGEQIYGVLKNDIELDDEDYNHGGTMSTAFSGGLDGQGHSIKLKNFKSALFFSTNNTTFKNLRITGSYTLSEQGAALVERSKNTTFENCQMDLTVIGETPYWAAFAFTNMEGRASTYGVDHGNSTTTFKNCLVTNDYSQLTFGWPYGFIVCGAANLAFRGIYKSNQIQFDHVVYAPKSPHGRYDQAISSDWNPGNAHFSTLYVAKKSTDVEEYDTNYKFLPENKDEALTLLGTGWYASESWPYVTPIHVADGTKDSEFEFLINAPKFYFAPNGKVKENSLIADTRQSSVMLTWEVEGGAIDYFQVLRREIGKEEWKIIAPDVIELGYEDTTTSPTSFYEYKVRSAVECEGIHYNETEVVEGQCEHSGKLEGYVRYPDGTGLAGVTVWVTANGSEYKLVTDDKGHYERDGLSYFNQNSIVYAVTPEGVVLEKGFESSTAEFNSESNYVMVPDFIVISGFKFAGKVMYNGTSIPVPGVQFQVNGHKVHNASGKPLETDNEGRFLFYVNEGNNKIQAMLDKHEFYEDGWYKGETGRTYGYDIHGDVNVAYFYDDTKVKLIGRVAGGSAQGNLPLANSLSHNNLGDTIVMVLALEGDNKSRLVYDNLDQLKERVDTVFYHKKHDNTCDYHTMMTTTRRNVKIWPDPHTGEYEVLLPPVKWKVQQIYATGYATLFQEGKVSDVIDLTEELDVKTDKYKGPFNSYGGADVQEVTVEYNAIYNRIWHAPVELTYQQMGFNNFGYFGDLNYSFSSLDGKKAVVPLAYEVNVDEKSTAVKEVKYTFGHPVFSIEHQYPFKLAAVERYYWNNNSLTDTIDVVKLNGGKVAVQNGMISSTHKEEVELDENGEGMVAIKAAQIPYMLTGEDAIRTVTMTLTLDGSSYEATPLDAYVLNVYTLPGAKDIVSVEKPILVDILRDPPGGGSKATLSKGSELKYSYSMDMEWKIGTGISFKTGSSIANFTGVVAAPMGGGGVAGFNYGAETDWETSIDLIANGKGKRGFSYTLKAGNDISTSDNSKLVGAPADVFIGIQQSVSITPATAIRAVPDASFKQMGGAVKSGQVLEIATGEDAEGNIFHLVRDEALAVGPKFKSTFMHTQRHIITNILPDLMNRTKALMFTGSQAEAQAVADKTQKPVYLALLDPDDENFAVYNTKDKKYYSYTSKSPDTEGMHYRIILPSNYQEGTDFTDEVYQLNQTMLSWTAMLAQNEKEKLSATELVKNFDVDGGVGTSYEEEFESGYDYAYSLNIPIFTDIYDNFFGTGVGEYIAGGVAGLAAELSGPLFKYLSSIGKLTKESGAIAKGFKIGDNEVEVQFVGTKMSIDFTPALEFSNTPEFGKDRSWSRKESFDIGMDKKSHLNFDVFRVNTVDVKDVADSEQDVFTSEKFYENVDYDNGYISRYFTTSGFKYAKSFVYRTRGGATCRPYEGERVTSFYKTGEVLDEATKQIEKPVIRMDKQSVSGVPFGEAARFQLYLANESESPANVYPDLKLYLDDKSNPNGAILRVDGVPLTWDGLSISVDPGKVTEKTLEVLAGDTFDYEGITLGLQSSEEIEIFDEVSFDVHFLHTAGPVNISSPGDKWVMNTDAPHDKNGYHIPVTIDGFNKNQHNFDHIEFQYKESSRGDDFWVNLCSFYADDSLYNLASGVKEMIPQNGNIETQFYGEGEIFEKAYDLRAVLFCRNGNDYITSSSKVLSGIKDTRRPRLFGTPEPATGVLNIGDNIVFNFSEAIEHNYLDDMVNFDVRGEVNSKNLSRQVSMLFSGTGGAMSEANRNFSNREVTIEMTIKPDDTNKTMPLFSHGNSKTGLQFLLTENKYLQVVIPNPKQRNNTLKYTSKKAIESRDFVHVALVFLAPDTLKNTQMMKMYIGNECVGEFERDVYVCSGKLLFGSSNETAARSRTYYSGKMMEARVWYRAFDSSLFQIYGNQRLSGYEMGLVDYYPMNEGIGDLATDKAQGATLQMEEGVTWSQPNSMSLHIDLKDEGIPLNKDFLNRSKEFDYTLMFWFKTDQKGRGVLISNGSGDADEDGAENRFCIEFDANKLSFKTNGREYPVAGYWSDGMWHHFAMTINRAHNVGNIYVDQKLRSTFSADSIGGISEGYPMLGAAKKVTKVDGNIVIEDTRNWLTGNIDEICMFAQALPFALIKSYSTKCPEGDETGLIFYMSFSQDEDLHDGGIEVSPYIYSQKIYKNLDGSLVYEKDPETQKDTTTPKRDYIFDKEYSKQDLLAHIASNSGAPTSAYKELEHLQFSFVGKDNQLLVDINEIDEKINKRNVYVTVRDIPDLNGNELASPVTATFFIDRNPLRWEMKTVNVSLYEDMDEDETLEIDIYNNSATSHVYTIQNIPKWLRVTPVSNVIEARGEATLTFKIDRNLDVGFYDDIIYLTDEDGISEPLALNVTVEGNEPDWEIADENKRFTMSFIGQVLIQDEIDTDERDIVGVFNNTGECVGKAHVEYDENTGENGLYITIYSDNREPNPLTFCLWRYSTGRVMQLNLTTMGTIDFEPNAVVGADSPVVLVADVLFVQTLQLAKGWNWISPNVYNDHWATDLMGLMNSFTWTLGDIWTDNTNNTTMTFDGKDWLLSESESKFSINPQHMYCIYVHEPMTLQLSGSILDQDYQRTISLKHGWNSIGYTPMVSLPIATALTDYHDHAMNGDVIKSHSEFAVLTITSNNSHIWNGNLKYMHPGEGYMFYRQKNEDCQFMYPFYEPGSVFFASSYNAPARRAVELKATTMTMAAVTDGVELEAGDQLLAFSDGELCGAAVAQDDDGIFYMSISAESRSPLWFAIERNDDLIATTRENMRYEANKVLGSPSEPTTISFTQADLSQEGWYTLSGIKLSGKPDEKGVYIFNGKKYVIK